MLRRDAVLLADSLGDPVGGEDCDHGAFLVATDWVAQIGALQPDAAAELTRRWMAAMAREYGDPEIQPTPPAVAAVASLISLCRRAVETSTPVIHAWFL